MIKPYQSPTIANVALTTANTEYSYVLPAGTKRFRFKLRDVTKTLRYAFESGKVATPTNPYMTVPANTGGIGNWMEDVDFSGQAEGLRTIYFASPDATQVVEIETWQ